MVSRHRFYTPGLLQRGATVTLSNEESHHASKVLRLKASEIIEILNGEGSIAQGKILQVQSKRCTVQLEEVEQFPQQNGVQLVFALPKPAALEFILRRITEIGIASFQPLSTKHSMHFEWNELRWKRLLIEVAKQCQESHFPKLYLPKRLEVFLFERDGSIPLFLCNESDRASAASAAKASCCEVMVGAEGGWAAEEVKACLDAGAIPYGLGKNRLRAETAALVSTVLLKKEMGEFTTMR